MTPTEYLAWERGETSKHEYHHGEVFAMAGGSPRHNFLSGAMVAELRAALRAKPCHVLTSDQRVSAIVGKRYVYADAVVACGGVEIEPGSKDVLANPRILVEVLSPNTESCDRAEKWEWYQALPSLSDYLLVSQTVVRIEHFLREAEGSWRYRVHRAGDVVLLSEGVTLSVDAIYRDAFDLTAG